MSRFLHWCRPGRYSIHLFNLSCARIEDMQYNLEAISINERYWGGGERMIPCKHFCEVSLVCPPLHRGWSNATLHFHPWSVVYQNLFASCQSGSPRTRTGALIPPVWLFGRRLSKDRGDLLWGQKVLTKVASEVACYSSWRPFCKEESLWCALETKLPPSFSKIWYPAVFTRDICFQRGVGELKAQECKLEVVYFVIFGLAIKKSLHRVFRSVLVSRSSNCLLAYRSLPRLHWSFPSQFALLLIQCSRLVLRILLLLLRN